jgi:signal transduction histidine kinase
VARLINSTKAVIDGSLDSINLGKDYSGELLELKKVLEAMVEELKMRESRQEEKLKAAAAVVPSSPIADISSELNTPLYSIAGAAEEAIKSDQHLNEHSRKALLVLVDNLYDYAKLEQGNLVYASEPFNLCELVDEIASFAKELAGLKEIEVIADCQEVFTDMMVPTDRSLLSKLLLNLVSNAVNNTDAGTITILCTEISKDGADFIEMSVADTGKGYDSNEMEGFGLFMSRKLAEILGGNLQLESQAGKGSVLTAIIPIKALVQ